MKIALLVLGDIHFSRSGESFPLERTDLIAGAVSAENVQLDGLVIAFVGDIANSGSAEEYETAKIFIAKLKASLKEHYPSLEPRVVAIPGNHDCRLAIEEIDLRKTQVESSIGTFNKEKPDKAFVSQLLDVQVEYWKFVAAIGEVPTGDYGRLFSSASIEFGNHKIEFRLYNSAALSQRKEKEGDLYLPVRLLSKEIPNPTNDGIVISLVHHPINWLESNNYLAFRRHLLRTCDLVLTGHQHKGASFRQTHDTGESLRFLESPALFDSSGHGASGFRLVTFDLPANTMKDCQIKDCEFDWRDNLYRPKSKFFDWRPFELNRVVRPTFELDPSFLEAISDPGIVNVYQSERRRVALPEIFVYPDLMPTGKAGINRVVRGPEVIVELSKSGIHLIQGDAFSGKTALANSLFYDFFAQDIQIPLMIDGASLTARDANRLERRVKDEFARQYANADIDAYMQLKPLRRAVIIDDWHRARLTGEQRVAIYKWLQDFAVCTILLTDKLYDVSRILTTQADIEETPTEDSLVKKFELLGLSHVSRGTLINRWLELRKNTDLEPARTSKESKTTEDELSRIMGKDGLPPYAFFILCLLQARENHTLNKIAGGSFGHLFEVLVNSALAKGEIDELNHEKKYALLSEVAAHLWINQRTWISIEEITEVSSSYQEKYLVELNPEKLLPALESSFMPKRSGDAYAFTYPRFYYYFVANYIKERIDDAEDSRLTESIDYMIDNISSEMNSAIVMFLIYFAKEKRRIIDRLVGNASLIYSEIEPAKLEEDATPFFFRKEDPATPEVPDDVDIAKNRDENRRRLDERETSEMASQSPLANEVYFYTEDLSDAKKLHLADRHLDALGQIVRNFSTTLLEKDKTKVLQWLLFAGAAFDRPGDVDHYQMDRIG
jgi:predicted phosphodiesterase